MARHPAGPASTAARLTWGALGGTALEADERSRLALGLGGVVLFDRNVESPAQLRALTASIRASAAGPVRVSTDQEGGHVVRVAEPMTRFPGPMAIAATGSLRLAYAVAAASARELRSVGVDTVLAPVLDVAARLESPAVGVRSYGDATVDVARFAAAAVRGYLDGGVLPVPKHFPGHGRTAEDSHVGRPRVGGGTSDLRRTDLPPFRAAIAAGSPMLMTSHVTYDALDPDQPASLSPATAQLARDMGFDGVLVTDALVMDAVAHRLPLEEAGVSAILAGMDVAMAIEGQRAVLTGLADAIDRYRIPVGRLREALQRAATVNALASTLGDRALGEPLPDDVLAAHGRLAEEVAAGSITLVSDAGGVLPLDPATSVVVIDTGSAAGSPVEGEAGRPDGAGERLAAALPRARAILVAPDDAARPADAADAAEGAEAVVMLTRDAFGRAATREILARLVAARRPVVHVALRNPLDLARSRAAARIAAYGDSPATIDALARALLGEVPFGGTLPVTLPRDAAAALDGLEAFEFRKSSSSASQEALA